MLTTQRDLVRQHLTDEPDGLSKSELRKRINGNAGTFRRLIQSMTDQGDIDVTTEHRKDCGPTRVHRLTPLGAERHAEALAADAAEQEKAGVS